MANHSNKKLEELREEIDKCVKCGTCRSVCPVFRGVGREPASTRGRITLVGSYLDGETGLTEAYIRQVKDCTLCGACTSNCPSGVPTPEIIAAARADLAEKEGTSTAASFLLRNLKSPGRFMPLAMKFASRMQSIFLKDNAGETGLLSRFPLPIPGVGEGRLLPPLARTSFMDTPTGKKLRRETKKGDKNGEKTTAVATVAFYVGCGVNYLMPNIGEATVKALEKAGARVVLPPGQVCCGMPAWSAGEAETAREMAVKNIEEFERYDVDNIVTSCATCGHGLRTKMREMVDDDPELAERAGKLASKVRDVSELLVELGYERGEGEDRREEGERRIVTYHDPCHLGRMQGVREQPRDLVKANPGLELREMSHPCRCCGFGGGLSLSDYDLSRRIAREKAESVRDSGADIVATGCPGCMVQLRDCLNDIGVDAEVRHVVELL